VGVVELPPDLDLAQEPLRPEGRSELLAEDFHRHPTVVLQIFGEVDRRHATVAELALDTVAVGQRRLEAVQQLGDQAAPEKVPAYIRAGTAQELE
jgi:hypothetical protein